MNKIPPYSKDSENKVLSACLAGNYAIFSNVLIEEDFFLEKNQLLFRAISKLYNENEEITKLQLYRKLGNDFKKIGGYEYIDYVESIVFSETDVINDAYLVLEKSMSRKAIEICVNTTKDIYSNEIINISSIANELSKVKDYIDFRIASTNKYDFNKDKLNAIETVKLAHDGKDSGLLFSNIVKIDDIIGGFAKKSLYIFGARPAGGKSALGIQLMYNFSIINGKKVALFSLEMSSEANINRILAHHNTKNGNRVTNFEIKKGFKYNDNKYDKFINESENFKTSNIFIYDNIYSIQSIKRKIMQLVKGEGLDCAIIDHFHIIQSETKSYNEISKYTEISGELKMIAKQANIPIICLAQLNRGTESRDDKMPMLSDLRGSGSIEQDADVVTFFYRPFYYDTTMDENELLMSVAKNRDGGTERFNLYVDIKNSTFLDEYQDFNILAPVVQNNEIFKQVEVNF